MSGTQAVLEVSDLSVDYLTRGGSVASLREVGLRIASGRILGVVGESGSGKSTLAAAIQGLLAANARVTSGTVRVGDTDMVTASPVARRTVRRTRLGVISQNPITSLDPTRTVRRTFRDVLADDRRMRELLIGVGFADPDSILASFPHQLSGGMAQRVAIAMAVAREPDVLVADEPTSALDPAVAGSVMSILADRAHEAGTALIVVTHDLQLVADHCDDVLVMRGGRVVETGTVAAVLKAPREEYTKTLISATQTLHADKRPPREISEAVVEIRGASVSFRSGPPWSRVRKSVIDDFSLTIHRGEMVGLVGPSGSGKTTVSRLLLGLQRPDSGAVLLDGRPLQSPRRARAGSVQVVLQHPDWAMNPSVRVGASIAEPLVIAGGIDRRGRTARVAAMLAQVGLEEDLAQRFPHELSGGQRQRASIARALIARPELIVFDEAVSSLDVSVQAQVLRLIGELQNELRFAGLFVSHDQGAVAYIADRVLHMSPGSTGPQNP